jgi:hypothetical protein
MRKGFSLITLLFLISLSYGLSAQSHEEAGEHEFKHFRIAAAIGHVYIPEANSEETNFVVVPTFGLEAQYWINHRWGIGLKSDIEISTYFVKNDDSTELLREFPVIIAMPVLLSPWENHFTFILGPGIELEEHQNFSVFRVGFGSEFEIGNHWDFAPEIIYDLKDGHINTFNLAIAIGMRF